MSAPNPDSVRYTDVGPQHIDDLIACACCGEDIDEGDECAEVPMGEFNGRRMVGWAHPWCAVKDGLRLRYPADVRRDREIDRLRAENDAWMHGVADAVEHLGFDREAACGPADLLPGLRMLAAQIDGSAGGA